MDNWLLIELIAKERSRERQLDLERGLLSEAIQQGARFRPRQRVAAALVRLGLALDPRAGDRLRASERWQPAPEASR